jgi:hypothetical protein
MKANTNQNFPMVAVCPRSARRSSTLDTGTQATLTSFHTLALDTAQRVSALTICVLTTVLESAPTSFASLAAPTPPANGDASQLMLHAQMYEIADKYDVTGLKELAREKFLRACAKYWNDDHFAPAAHHAFTSTSEDDYGLKKVVSSTISQHMALLKKPEVEALLTEFNGLALGLLKARATELGWV